jgi:hypothetical protein
MGFKIQSAAGAALPAGVYLAQVADFAEVEGEDFRDRTKKVPRMKWMLDVRARGSKEWVRQTRFTGVTFTDPKGVSDPRFISALTRLVLAMGLKVPVTAEELQEFEQVELIGRQFVIRVELDPVTEKLVEHWERVPTAAAEPRKGSPAATRKAAPPAPAPPPAAADEELFDEEDPFDRE